MMQPRLLRLGLLLIAAGALLFWSRGLGQRLMHQDEAIGADKFHELWGTHKYKYDPHEYHGPTLNYFTLPVVWMSGASSYVQTTEGTYRIVTVLFGVGLILLLRLVAHGGREKFRYVMPAPIETLRGEGPVLEYGAGRGRKVYEPFEWRPGLGWVESLVAGVIIAISPAMSFYARYYIHEMLLVFFIFLAIGSAWRYSQGGRKRWAYLCGIGLGLAYATKETWVLSVAAMGLGLGFALLWTRVVDGRVPELRERLRWKVFVGAAVVGLIVAAILFSGLLTNWHGPIDAIKTYSTYVQRGTGAGDHDKPFDYYLGLLVYKRYGKGPIHTEAFILVLAVVGAGRALWPSMEGGLGRAVLLRFLAFYTISLMLIYSAVPYKTPWCLLGFLHGMILLAGVGAVAIVRGMPHLALRYIMAAILMAPAGHLAYQAWRINYDPKFINDQRFNPYLYSTPVGDFVRLMDRIREVAAVSPSRKAVSIKIVTADMWPLPWYLRDFESVSYYASSTNARPETAYIVIGSAEDAHLERVLGDEWVVQNYGLRRQVILSMYVYRKLWDEMPFNKGKKK